MYVLLDSFLCTQKVWYILYLVFVSQTSIVNINTFPNNLECATLELDNKFILFILARSELKLHHNLYPSFVHRPRSSARHTIHHPPPGACLIIFLRIHQEMAKGKCKIKFILYHFLHRPNLYYFRNCHFSQKKLLKSPDKKMFLSSEY